jgi:hypothetical protein
MIKINICGTEQVFDDSLASWINEQYHNRKRAGVNFWFIITIENSNVHLTLFSADAPNQGGTPYDHFNHNEKQIIDMWREMGAKQDNDASNLLKFLGKLKSIIA